MQGITAYPLTYPLTHSAPDRAAQRTEHATSRSLNTFDPARTGWPPIVSFRALNR